MDVNIDIDRFITDQLDSWPQAKAAYDALGKAETRTIDLDGYKVTLQHNPARIKSSAARLDAESIAKRGCFLCRHTRPKEQLIIPAGEYDILVNPYPIFAKHLTLPSVAHEPQRVMGRVCDMVKLAHMLKGMTIFYNGPRCGASAPDHHHFQAAPSECFPIWQLADKGEMPQYPAAIMVHTAMDAENVLQRLPHKTGEEPDVNILMRSCGQQDDILIIPRRKHRPDCYGTEGKECVLLSPASVDMGGMWILPRKCDFDNLTADKLKEILHQTAYTADELPSEQPIVSVGILSAPKISITFHGTFITQQGETITGYHTFDNPTELHPSDPANTFTIHEVKIGIGFHWEQKFDQRFNGAIRIIRSDDHMLTAINDVAAEEYLKSVITSEMNADAPEEFLKAHAVISRSWLMAMITPCKRNSQSGMRDTATERIKWYDRKDHTLFHVCADDHCQRYQGIRHNMPQSVTRAIDATQGMVLTYDGELCDARFSKCCGGAMERFSTCWGDTDMKYLTAKRDVDNDAPLPDLTDNNEAEIWCETRPDAFCANPSKELLKTVLNGYDRTTDDFYRWKVAYSADELAELLRKRTGVEFGKIISLTPLHRGPSARIDKLEITGTKHSMVIGKELEIRRSLSESHLYSSAFVAIPGEMGQDGIPLRWILKGAGWGHGVGLCQIGAAVMANKGYDYLSILSHYYPGTKLSKIY